MNMELSDQLVYDAAVFVVTEGVCSINKIQVKFEIGFNKAMRVVDMLQSMGIVSSTCGIKGRDILVSLAEVEKKFNNK